MFSDYDYLTTKSKFKKFKLKFWLKKVFDLNIKCFCGKRHAHQF